MKMLKRHSGNRKSGQGMVEYIIIVVVIALAAIAIISLFGETIRERYADATEQIGGTRADADEAVQETDGSLRDLD